MVDIKDLFRYWKKQIEYWEKSNEPVINAAVKVAQMGGVGIERLKDKFDKAPPHQKVELSPQDAAELTTKLTPFHYEMETPGRGNIDNDTTHPYTTTNSYHEAAIINKKMEHRLVTQKRKIGVRVNE